MFSTILGVLSFCVGMWSGNPLMWGSKSSGNFFVRCDLVECVVVECGESLIVCVGSLVVGGGDGVAYI